MSLLIGIVAVCVVAGAVAAAELGSRFRDEPGRVLRSRPGLLYIAINCVTSAAVLGVAVALDWRFGVPEDAPEDELLLVQVLVAGLGSAVLLRSALLTVRVGETDIGVGPSAAVTALLGMVERATDRRRAQDRLRVLDHLTEQLSFARDFPVLIELSSYSLQTLELAEADALGDLAASLEKNSGLSDADRLDRFALALLNITGETTLRSVAKPFATDSRRSRQLTELTPRISQMTTSLFPTGAYPTWIKLIRGLTRSRRLWPLRSYFQRIGFSRYWPLSAGFRSETRTPRHRQRRILVDSAREFPSDLHLRLLIGRVTPATLVDELEDFDAHGGAIASEAHFLAARYRIEDEASQFRLWGSADSNLSAEALTEHLDVATRCTDDAWRGELIVMEAIASLLNRDEGTAAQCLGKGLDILEDRLDSGNLRASTNDDMRKRLQTARAFCTLLESAGMQNDKTVSSLRGFVCDFYPDLGSYDPTQDASLWRIIDVVISPLLKYAIPLDDDLPDSPPYPPWVRMLEGWQDEQPGGRVVAVDPILAVEAANG